MSSILSRRMRPAGVHGGLPVPLHVVYGSTSVGAAGVGWDIPLSCIRRDVTLTRHRPISIQDSFPQSFAFDNQGDLARNAGRPEIQQRIIDGRIRHLEGEIRNFQQWLERLRSGSVEP